MTRIATRIRSNELPAIRSELEIRAQASVELVADAIADEMRTALAEHRRSGATEAGIDVDVERGRKRARALSPDIAAEVLEIGRPSYHTQPARPFARGAAFAGLRKAAPKFYALMRGL